MMDPCEVEFLAEKEHVTIVPNFSHDKFYLITGDIGPFNPGLPVDIPLWLAVNLKQRQKCRIQPPEWMNVEMLQAKKQEEKESPVFESVMNPHFMEISKLLLTHAADDITNADEVHALIKDLWDIRAAKLRQSVDKFVREQATYAKLDNLSVMEINTVRPFLTQALDHMYTLKTNTM